MPRNTIENLSRAAEIAGLIKSRILMGVYRLNQMLPTAEMLAKQFSVDPNTARAAYARLAKLGLVKSIRGKGTFVTANIEPGRATQLNSLINSAVVEGRKLGISPEDLATILWVQERLSADQPWVWYIDTWYPYYDAIVRQIEKKIGNTVHTLRLQEGTPLPSGDQGPLDGDTIITTKFHLEMLKYTYGELDLAYVLITPSLTKDTLVQLGELPKTSQLGVICVESAFANISGKVIENSNIQNDQVRGNTSEISSLTKVFDRADAITISTVALDRLKSAHIRLPDKPIIPFAYQLSDATLEKVAKTTRERAGAA